jgi:dipeptidyl aminopeptidase/acylaminoacyl peptidase
MNRPIDPDFDQRIADWLEDDPITAPREVLGTVLAAYPSIPQRRAWRMPWRFQPMNRFAIPAGAALVVVLVAILAAPSLVSTLVGPTTAPTVLPTNPPPTTPQSTAAPSPTARVDWSDLGGRILVEHLGNAIDESEMPTTDYHPERRRLYFMDPATMSRADAVEFLPDEPSTGKLNADVSADGSKVVFMDTAQPAQIWLVNIDGSGLRRLSKPCDCSELDPAFDPTGENVVYVHLENGRRMSQNGANMGHDQTSPTTRTWLEIRNLSTDEVTVLVETAHSDADGWPAQPSWSPDGKQIVYDRITWYEDEATPPTGVLEIVDVASGKVSELPIPGVVPGDADWSPDGSRILFSDPPISEMGSIGTVSGRGMFTVSPDGSNLTNFNFGSGGSWLPDGRILFQNNNLWVMNGDGTERHEVSRGSNDLTELPFGFVYISHWIPPR